MYIGCKNLTCLSTSRLAVPSVTSLKALPQQGSLYSKLNLQQQDRSPIYPIESTATSTLAAASGIQAIVDMVIEMAVLPLTRPNFSALRTLLGSLKLPLTFTTEAMKATVLGIISFFESVSISRNVPTIHGIRGMTFYAIYLIYQYLFGFCIACSYLANGFGLFFSSLGSNIFCAPAYLMAIMALINGEYLTAGIISTAVQNMLGGSAQYSVKVDWTLPRWTRQSPDDHARILAQILNEHSPSANVETFTELFLTLFKDGSIDWTSRSYQYVKSSDQLALLQNDLSSAKLLCDPIIWTRSNWDDTAVASLAPAFRGGNFVFSSMGIQVDYINPNQPIEYPSGIPITQLVPAIVISHGKADASTYVHAQAFTESSNFTSRHTVELVGNAISVSINNRTLRESLLATLSTLSPTRRGTMLGFHPVSFHYLYSKALVIVVDTFPIKLGPVRTVNITSAPIAPIPMNYEALISLLPTSVFRALPQSPVVIESGVAKNPKQQDNPELGEPAKPEELLKDREKGSDKPGSGGKPKGDEPKGPKPSGTKDTGPKSGSGKSPKTEPPKVKASKEPEPEGTAESEDDTTD